MLVEARVQAELLYSLRAIMRHMTWIRGRFRLLFRFRLLHHLLTSSSFLLPLFSFSLSLFVLLSKFNQLQTNQNKQQQQQQQKTRP